MHGVTRFVVVTATVAGLALPVSASAATPPTEAAKVRAVIVRQNQLFNAANWRALYRLYTPRYRAACPYGRFVAGNREARAILGRIATRNIVVRLRGNRALLSYRGFAHGRLVITVRQSRPDVYVRIGGRWYDELDYLTPGC